MLVCTLVVFRLSLDEFRQVLDVLLVGFEYPIADFADKFDLFIEFLLRLSQFIFGLIGQSIELANRII